MIGRLARVGLAGAALLALAGCVTAPAAEPVPSIPAEPLPTATAAPIPSLEVERLALEVVADAASVWSAYLAARGIATPAVETVVLHADESHPAACAGQETDPIVTSDDEPVVIGCPDGTATIVVPLEPLVPLDDFAAAFLVARAYGGVVASALAVDGGEHLASCLAGVWAADADARGLLDEGDADEVRELLAGDDAGRAAFLQGFEGLPGLARGDVDECVHVFAGQ